MLPDGPGGCRVRHPGYSVRPASNPAAAGPAANEICLARGALATNGRQGYEGALAHDHRIG